MTGIAITLMLGHPLALTPVVQTVGAAVTDQSQVWMTAQAPGAAAPGPLTPPVLA